uniref:DUF169 domain-containing protein n=1 Tax=Candidatus Methanomethylicus mesodigestus TaxID=1867258 RepID=A0A7C3J4E4_9CREN
MDCREAAQRLKDVLGLSIPPVAVKFLKQGEQVPNGFPLAPKKMRFCQAVMEATWGRSISLPPTELACGPGPGTFGVPVKEKVAKGEVHHAFGLFESPEAAAKCLSANAKGLPGQFSMILVSPLEQCTIYPDVVVLRLNAEQAMWVCHSRSYKEGKHLVFDFQTEASVCSSIGMASYLKGEVQLGLGCYGSRSNTEMRADELLVGIPGNLLETTVEALEKLRKPMADSRAKRQFYEAYPEKRVAGA